LFVALLFFNLILFAAIKREMEMARKKDMARILAMGKEMERRKDGGNEDREIKSVLKK
jgi:predicted membrane protein